MMIDGKEHQVCEKCNKFFLKGVRSRRYCLPCAAKRKYTAVENESKKCSVCEEMFVPSNKSKNFCSEGCKDSFKIKKLNARWTKEKKKRKINRDWGKNFHFGD